MRVANGCFVESVACYDACLETFGDQAWARVLQWGAKEEEGMVAGHAVLVFESAGALGCWDINYGWSRLPVSIGDREDEKVVSAPILVRYPKVTAIYPTLAGDDDQKPEAGLAGGEGDDEAEGARDAGRAAVRLARHRPVNLIEITHLESGESQKGEAVEFEFGGRMCIYVPATGTTTFRARSTVWNVPLTLEMLRRLYPTLQSVRTLKLPAEAP